MLFNESKGNLFAMGDEYTFVHCISKDCAMGAGIAVSFNEMFPDMKRELKRTVYNNKMNTPCTILYKDDTRSVFNLITKNLYFQKPTLSSIKHCIKEMKMICEQNNIKYLAMPKIGCGLDKLNWDIVREIIKSEFEDTNIQIEVRYL